MMSRKAQDNLLSVANKEAEKDTTTVQDSQDVQTSMKTQVLQSFKQAEKATKTKKNTINVKNSMRINELVVKEDFDFGMPSYKQKLGAKLQEKKEAAESMKQKPITAGGMSDMDEF